MFKIKRKRIVLATGLTIAALAGVSIAVSCSAITNPNATVSTATTNRITKAYEIAHVQATTTGTNLTPTAFIAALKSANETVADTTTAVGSSVLGSYLTRYSNIASTFNTYSSGFTTTANLSTYNPTDGTVTEVSTANVVTSTTNTGTYYFLTSAVGTQETKNGVNVTGNIANRPVALASNATTAQKTANAVTVGTYTSWVTGFNPSTALTDAESAAVTALNGQSFALSTSTTASASTDGLTTLAQLKAASTAFNYAINNLEANGVAKTTTSFSEIAWSNPSYLVDNKGKTLTVKLIGTTAANAVTDNAFANKITVVFTITGFGV